MPKKRSTKSLARRTLAPFVTQFELAQLGGGKVGYIKTISAYDALRAFPDIEYVPENITLFALHAADGNPIMLTDSREAVLRHAQDECLELVRLH